MSETGNAPSGPGDDGRLRRLEARAASAERLLASARGQLALGDAALGAARARAAAAEEALRLTRQHASNLEDLRDALGRRIGELDTQCAHLTRVIGERESEIGRLRAAEARKAAMEASFSWRATAPLRWLRRRLGGRASR
jgi:chromosome segregation ATPase